MGEITARTPILSGNSETRFKLHATSVLVKLVKSSKRERRG